MCGIIPFDHCADSRVSSSTTARSTLSGANPTATNAASQLHMCGYSNGAAVVITPRALPRSRYAARAASCVSEKLGSGAIGSILRPVGRARPPTGADRGGASFDVRVIGAVALTQALLPALRAFADSLRLEELSLRVTSVHPGRIATATRRQQVKF